MAYGQDDEFILNKGFDNEFLITIKQNETTLPMIIDDSDVFKFYLYDYETQTVLAILTNADSEKGSIIATDKDNGQITIKFKKDFIDTLDGQRGSYADRYYLKPTHYGIIDAITVNNGNFISRIDEIFVN